jgi:hypothetical protein
VALPAVTVEVSMGFDRRQVRVRFAVGADEYSLKMTDPYVVDQYLAGADGDFRSSGPVLMCISVGEPLRDYRYKLAASLIPLA